MNEIIFVLERWELSLKNIKITTKCILKKISTHRKCLNNNDFPLSLIDFIRMKVNTTLFLPGCYDVVQYSVLRK